MTENNYWFVSLTQKVLGLLLPLTAILFMSGCAAMLFDFSDNAREGDTYDNFKDRQDRDKQEWISTHPEVELKH